MSKDCPNCPAFGKHCPHKLSGDPYFYDCYLTVAELEEENTELKETLKTYNGCGDWDNDFHTCRVYLQHEELQKREEQLTKAKVALRNVINYLGQFCSDYPDCVIEAEQFLKECK